jgi:hypothetical protein
LYWLLVAEYPFWTTFWPLVVWFLASSTAAPYASGFAPGLRSGESAPCSTACGQAVPLHFGGNASASPLPWAIERTAPPLPATSLSVWPRPELSTMAAERPSRPYRATITAVGATTGSWAQALPAAPQACTARPATRATTRV